MTTERSYFGAFLDLERLVSPSSSLRRLRAIADFLIRSLPKAIIAAIPVCRGDGLHEEGVLRAWLFGAAKSIDFPATLRALEEQPEAAWFCNLPDLAKINFKSCLKALHFVDSSGLAYAVFGRKSLYAALRRTGIAEGVAPGLLAQRLSKSLLVTNRLISVNLSEEVQERLRERGFTDQDIGALRQIATAALAAYGPLEDEDVRAWADSMVDAVWVPNFKGAWPQLRSTRYKNVLKKIMMDVLTNPISSGITWTIVAISGYFIRKLGLFLAAPIVIGPSERSVRARTQIIPHFLEHLDRHLTSDLSAKSNDDSEYLWTAKLVQATVVEWSSWQIDAELPDVSVASMMHIEDVVRKKETILDAFFSCADPAIFLVLDRITKALCRVQQYAEPPEHQSYLNYLVLMDSFGSFILEDRFRRDIERSALVPMSWADRQYDSKG